MSSSNRAKDNRWLEREITSCLAPEQVIATLINRDYLTGRIVPVTTLSPLSLIVSGLAIIISNSIFALHCTTTNLWETILTSPAHCPFCPFPRGKFKVHHAKTADKVRLSWATFPKLWAAVKPDKTHIPVVVFGSCYQWHGDDEPHFPFSNGSFRSNNIGSSARPAPNDEQGTNLMGMRNHTVAPFHWKANGGETVAAVDAVDFICDAGKLRGNGDGWDGFGGAGTWDDAEKKFGERANWKIAPFPPLLLAGGRREDITTFCKFRHRARYLMGLALHRRPFIVRPFHGILDN